MAEEDVFAADGTTSVSGLAVPFRVPPSLVRLRRRWDFAALAGAGAHVTVLFPFLPCPELDRGVRAELAAIADRIRALGVTVLFTEVGTPQSVVDAIAGETGVRVVTLPSHTLPADGSYFTFIRDIATAIAGALTAP